MTLALIAAAWLIGLLLGFWLEVPPLPLLLLALSTLPLGLLLKLVGMSPWPVVLAGVLLLGVGGLSSVMLRRQPWSMGMLRRS
jgi:hypothetical protein